MGLTGDLGGSAGSDCDSRRGMELPAEIRSLIEGLQRRIETLEARVAELERENAALAGGERRFEAQAWPRQFDEFEAAVERRLAEEADEPARAVRQDERGTGRPQGRYAQAGCRSGPDRAFTRRAPVAIAAPA